MRLADFVLIEGLDSSGIYGGIFDYAQVFIFFGTALIAFIFFWSKGQLDMDEEPKFQMMQERKKGDEHEF